MDFRKLYLPLLSRASVNNNTGRKVSQAIHLLKDNLHHSQAMEDMARHHRSNHRDRTVEDISRYVGFYIRMA